MSSRFYNLQDFFRAADAWGLTDVILPFMLIFIIFFAILEKAKVLGNEKKNLNIGVSLIVSLMVVIPHILGLYPAGGDVVEIMNRALPSVSLVVVAIIMLLVLLGIFGGDAHLVGIKMGNWVAVIALVIIVWIFGGSAGWWGDRYGFWSRIFGNDVVAIIIILLVFGMIIAFVTSEGDDNTQKGYVSRLSDDLKGMFGSK